MSFQNPVFIPGPTNMPEAVRQACFMPTIDHRSPTFGKILHPCLDGVRRVMKSKDAKIFIFPSTGTGGWETALKTHLAKATLFWPPVTVCSLIVGSICANATT
jgi:alanine-glyoxylate transaminase/serine-glyoxylate transaminase/serine-pyruvate transaminase